MVITRSRGLRGNVAVPVALACVYPLGYGARDMRANGGGRDGIHSAHGDQRGTESANQCRAGAPRRGFVVRRSLVDDGGTWWTGGRHKHTEGSSRLPLSRLSWTVLVLNRRREASQRFRGALNLLVFGQHEERPLASYWSIGIP
jgi:hypothetical protein